MLKDYNEASPATEIKPVITPASEKSTSKMPVRHKRDDELTTKERLKRKREKYRTMVKGIFRFYEAPGGTLDFVYHEFDGDPVERYSLIDGHYAEIPLGVAMHLNKNGWYPVHKNMLDESGRSASTIGKKIYRFGFQSLDFMDETGFNDQSNLIQSPDILY